MKIKYTISTYYGILLASLFGVASSTSAEPLVSGLTYQNPANILIAQSIKQSSNSRSIYPFRDESGKYGFINQSGKVVVKPQFSKILFSWDIPYFTIYFDLNLIPVKMKDKWGFINNDGKFVISPRFALVQPFTEGLAAVQIDNKWGYINTIGEIVIAPKFDSAVPFHEGLAGVGVEEKSDGKYIGHKIEFINKMGNSMVKPEFYQSQNYGISISSYFFNDGLRPVEVNGKWGYLNAKGEFAIKPQFAEAGFFSEGLAFVKVIENSLRKNKVINKSGQVVFTLDDDKEYLGRFSEGLAKFKIKDKSAYGFISKKGIVVVPPQFIDAEDFSEGLARVSFKGKREANGLVFKASSGYINKQGKFIISPRFEANVSHSGPQGKFHNGLAEVYTSDGNATSSVGYINKKGMFVWQKFRK